MSKKVAEIIKTQIYGYFIKLDGKTTAISAQQADTLTQNHDLRPSSILGEFLWCVDSHTNENLLVSPGGNMFVLDDTERNKS